MRGSPLQRSLCDGLLLVLCIFPCGDDTSYHRRSQSLFAKRLRPLGCDPCLISDLVGQAKSTAFSVEGNAHYQKLPDRFPPISGIPD